LVLSWGGVQLLVATVGQSLGLSAIAEGGKKLSVGVWVFIALLVFGVLGVYFFVGAIHVSQPSFIFWLLSPLYVLRAYMYGVSLKKSPGLIHFLLVWNLISIFILFCAWYAFGLLDQYFYIFVAMLPCVELLALILACFRGVKLSDSSVKEGFSLDKEVLDWKGLFGYFSIANSSQFSMQVFLIGVANISASAAAVTGLAYQVRAIPLAIASAVGQVVLRRGVGLSEFYLWFLVLLAFGVAIGTCLVGWIVVSFGGAGFNVAGYVAGYYFVLFQSGLWFCFSILNSWIAIKRRSLAGWAAALMLAPSLWVFFAAKDFFYASLMYTLGVFLLLSFMVAAARKTINEY
jgi:hypothetical protein